MRIAEPSYLYLLWLIPLLLGFYVWSFRRREALLKRFASAAMLARLIPAASVHRQRIKAALLTTGIIFALFSLLRPQWGFHWEEITREGVDIIVAFDVSQSMMAQDVQPNRLKRAKRELEDLLQKLEGDRIGLIAFAGNAFLQCPLTLDYGAFRMFLDYLQPELIPVPGTSIGDAIRLANESFTKQSSTSKALILITDGEDHEGDPLGAAKEAKEAGIQIYAIGIGAAEGAPIPSPDGDGFIKDRRGQLEMTRIDEETLQRIALATGGAYVRSTTGDLDLDRIYTEGIKRSLEAVELKSGRQKRWEERFQWPLLITLLMIFIEPFVRERGRRQLFGLLLAGLMAACIPTPVYAGFLGDDTIQEGLEAYQAGDFETALEKLTDAKIEHPDDPLLDYNLGNAYYRTRRFEDAEASYQRALSRAGDDAFRAQTYFNLGNTAFRQGKLDQAVAHYEKALELTPDDLDAKQNLEKTRAEIQRRIDENQQRQEEQKQEQDQEQSSQSSGGEQNEGEGGQPNPAEDGEQNQDADQAQSDEAQQGDDANQTGAQTQSPPDQGDGEETPNQQQQEEGGVPEEGDQARGSGEQQESDGQQEQGQQAASGNSPQENDQLEAHPQQVGQLSKEDAERLLDQVKDQQKAGFRSHRKPQRGRGSRSPGGKPW